MERIFTIHKPSVKLCMQELLDVEEDAKVKWNNMSIDDIFPLVESLPHDDKFRLMQFLISKLAIEEGINLDAKDKAPIKPVGNVYHSGRSDCSKRARDLLFEAKREAIQQRKR